MDKDKALRYAYVSDFDNLSLQLKLKESIEVQTKDIDFNDFFERQSKMSEKEKIKNLCDSIIDELLMISINMRDATKEEQEKVNKYIDSISIDTGINFWDLLEKAESKRKEVEE